MADSDLRRARRAKQAFHRFVRAGWRASTPYSLTGTGGPIVYLCDVPSGSLFAVALASDAFSNVATTLAKIGLSWDDVCSALSILIGRLAKRSSSVDHQAREYLPAATALYLLGTESYQKTRDNPRAAYLIVRYVDASTGAPVLRPNPMTTTGPLTPLQVQIAVEQVLAFDRAHYPERFPRAEVIPFRVKSSEDI